MAKQIVNVGTSANDGTGDTLRVSQQKANNNFDDLYDMGGVNITVNNPVTLTETTLDTALSDLAGGGSVNSVTGTTVDNTDPANPIVNVPNQQEVFDAGGAMYPYGYVESADGLTTWERSFDNGAGSDASNYEDLDGNNNAVIEASSGTEIVTNGITNDSQATFKTIGGKIFQEQRKISTDKKTTIAFTTPIAETTINFPAKNTDGSYTLATKDEIPAAITIDTTPTNGSPNAVSSDGTFDALATKVDKNTAITGATKTKITYDSKGLVTAGADLVASDLPTGIDASKINTGVVSNAEFNYLDGVTSPIQSQLDLRKKQVYSTGTSVTHTGSTSETTLLRITIPAGTLTTTDFLNINRIVIARGLSQATNVEIKLKLSTSTTLPSGTTDQIAACTFVSTHRSNMITRGLWQESGNINFFNPTINSNTDINSLNTAFGSAAFNNTSTTYYLYITATLVTGTDNVILRAVDITN